MKKIIASLSVLFLLAACVSNNGKYAAISNQPLNLYNLVGHKSVLARNVEGSSIRSTLFFTVDNEMSSLDEAITNVLLEHDGDYIANATVKYTDFHILWVYYYSEWNVKGDIVKIYR